MRSQLIRLNLGCGPHPLAGFINADRVALEGVDLRMDARDGLPFKDSALAEIRAYDFVSHVPPEQGVFIMNEFHRVLRPNGVLRLKFPEAPGFTAFQDPTHVSFWNADKLTYFIDGHRRREQYGVHHGVTARFVLTRQKRSLKQPWKFLTTGNLNYLGDYLLRAELRAVK